MATIPDGNYSIELLHNGAGMCSRKPGEDPDYGEDNVLLLSPDRLGGYRRLKVYSFLMSRSEPKILIYIPKSRSATIALKEVVRLCAQSLDA